MAHNLCLLSSSHFAKVPEEAFARSVTLACLKSCEKAESTMATSYQNSTFRAFRMKWMANLLPIGHRFKSWGAPHNILGYCRRCVDGKLEDLDHLLCCPKANLESFDTIFVMTFEAIWSPDDLAAPYVARLLLSRGLSIRDFDGVINDKL